MNQFAQRLVEDQEDLMVQLGISANTMIKMRIIDTGTNAQGTQFAPYSTRPMLTNCSALTSSACNELVGSKTKRRERQWVTINKGGKNVRLFQLEGGYKEYRDVQGRQTAFVDFSFSGRMWANVDLISTYQQHKAGEVVIGAKEQENKDKLAGNTKLRGAILDLSPSEVDQLKKMYELNILQVIVDTGL